MSLRVLQKLALFELPDNRAEKGVLDISWRVFSDVIAGDSEETRFDCAVIDEASQAITPALLLVLPYLNNPDGRDSDKMPVFVMAGDHQQLPPTVLSGNAPGAVLL